MCMNVRVSVRVHTVFMLIERKLKSSFNFNFARFSGYEKYQSANFLVFNYILYFISRNMVNILDKMHGRVHPNYM